MAESHSLGKQGEKLAAKHLIKSGYTIRDMNWVRGHKEIDIIAEDDDFVIFIEVKTRMSDFQVHPRDAVSVPKQRNLIFAAQAYIENNETDKETRFDIISIIVNGQQYELEHITDAFYPTL